MGVSGVLTTTGAVPPVDHLNSHARGCIPTGCRCSRCRPKADWNGNRAQRRAAMKAGIPKPKPINDDSNP
jgi:hypothetical protein